MARGLQTFPSVKTGTLEWVLVDRNRKAELEELRTRYRYSPLDLKEVLPPLQRPKVVMRAGYIFMILLYPMFNRVTREVRATEVDFFISPERLVTVNVDGFEPLNRLFGSCKQADKGHVCMSGEITQLLYALLNDMLESIFPMLVHINNDLDEIEKRLFLAYEKSLIQDLLRVKTNIVNIRRTMQPHQAVIHSLTRAAPQYFPIHFLRDYLDDLVQRAQEIWETLEVQKETADALHETQQSLIDFRINEIIKTLTILSVVMLPLTLLAAIFTMNLPNMPLVSNPDAFWIIVGTMAVLSVGMLGFFRYKKWF
jgi:magnesium transporter